MSAVDRFEDLVSWQRMYELSVEVFKATEHGAVSRDWKYRDQIRDAADSAERNVAEGFGRYDPAVFARFLDFSRGSAEETKALLKKGAAAGYFTQADFERLDALASRGLQAVARFQRYLRSPQARRNAERQRYSRDRLRRNENDSNEPNGPNEPNGSNDSNDPNDSNA